MEKIPMSYKTKKQRSKDEQGYIPSFKSGHFRQRCASCASCDPWDYCKFGGFKVKRSYVCNLYRDYLTNAPLKPEVK